MIELDRHIEILLLSNDCVIIPEFGGFMAHHVDARFDDRDNTFLPPLRTIGFNPQLKMNDSLLVQSYIEAYDISYPDALNRIATEVNEIRQCLETEGKYELNDIGILYFSEDGIYTFEPCEAGILSPELYGLGGVVMAPLSMIDSNIDEQIPTQEEEEKSTETPTFSISQELSAVLDDEDENKDTDVIRIKKSILRNAIAACIAIIAFFSFSTPLSNTNVVKSKIDTGFLTRIVTQEVSKPATHTALALPNSKVENVSMEKDLDIKKPNSYYSIVLASRVTRRNAANYVESLQAKGYKDARVLITANNVKVIYGSFDSESEAYSKLNRLHNNEIFADSWITKVEE